MNYELTNKFTVAPEMVSHVNFKDSTINDTLLYQMVEKLRIPHKKVVFAQAKLESMSYCSELYETNFNLFGMSSTTGGVRSWIALGGGSSANSQTYHGIWFDVSALTYETILSYDLPSRTITITPTGATWRAWVLGTPFTFTGAQTVTHAATQGLWFIAIDGSGNLVASQTAWDILAVSPVAIVYYDATTPDYLLLDERHHFDRNAEWHLSQHYALGTFVKNGTDFGLSGYTLSTNTDAGNQWALAGGTAVDEDINVLCSPVAAAGPYQTWRKSGAAGNFIRTARTLPFHYNAGTGFIQYNQFTGGSWQLTDVGNQQYVNYYIYAATSVETSKQIMVLPGQAVYSTLSAAKSEAASALDLTQFPSAEYVALYQVTFLAKTAFGNTGKCDIEAVSKISGTRVLSSSSAVSGMQNPMTAVGDLIAGSTAGAAIALPVGSNTNVLTVVGGVPAWAAPSGGYVLPAATSSVLGGVKPDGTSILNAAGVISATAASVGALATGGTAANSAQLGGVAAANYALAANVPVVATTVPLIDGVAAIGAKGKWADADHVHPVDTSRLASGAQAADSAKLGGTVAASYALTANVPVVGIVVPLMDGTATIGASGKWADNAHIHPTDTGRLAVGATAADSSKLGAQLPAFYQTAYTILGALGALANASGYLFNNGSGVLSYATPGGAGTVTSVSTAAANNGVTATWSMSSPTPALTIGLGNITPSSSTITKATTVAALTLADKAYSLETSTAATSNTTHTCSPYLNFYAGIWNGSINSQRGFTQQVVGISGSNYGYNLNFSSTDTANILLLTGNGGAATFISTVTATSFNGITALASVSSPPDATAAVVGTSTTVARQDHVHALNMTGDVTSVGVVTTLATTQAAVHTWSAIQTFTLGCVYTASAGGSTEGQVWNDSTQKAATVYVDGVKQFLSGTIFSMTADGTNGAATAATSIIGTGIGTKTTPGGFFVAGKTLRVRGTGVFTSTGTPGTATIKLMLGAVQVATSAAITPTISKTAAFYEFEFIITCRSATTVMGSGALYMDAVITAIAVPSAAVATIVNATTYVIDVTSTNSSASGCIWTTKTCIIEVLN